MNYTPWQWNKKEAKEQSPFYLKNNMETKLHLNNQHNIWWTNETKNKWHSNVAPFWGKINHSSRKKSFPLSGMTGSGTMTWGCFCRTREAWSFWLTLNLKPSTTPKAWLKLGHDDSRYTGKPTTTKTTNQGLEMASSKSRLNPQKPQWTEDFPQQSDGKDG